MLQSDHFTQVLAFPGAALQIEYLTYSLSLFLSHSFMKHGVQASFHHQNNTFSHSKLPSHIFTYKPLKFKPFPHVNQLWVKIM